MRNRNNQLGLTLLEVALSIAIISAVYVGVVNLADRFAEATKVSIAASQAKTFGSAVQSYVKEN